VEIWKVIHVFCACVSMGGFLLRGFWMFTDSPWFEHKLRKVLPHIVDTLLLISAIAMLLQWQLNPLEHPWILAKIIALFFYIGFGLIAFRFAKTKQQSLSAWLAAILTIIYIAQTAITKNPWVFN